GGALGCKPQCVCAFCAEDAHLAVPMMKSGFEKMPQTLPPGFPAHFLFADGLSSVETLLTNIQVHYLCVCLCVPMCVCACNCLVGLSNVCIVYLQCLTCALCVCDCVCVTVCV